MKQINAFLYTQEKISNNSQDKDKQDNYLYSKGIYKTTLEKEDLTPDYLEFSCKTINYVTGYVKTSRVIDIKYKATKDSSLFENDYLYINYSKNIKIIENESGQKDYKNYEVVICGKDIIPVLLAIKKNSSINTDEIQEQLTQKFNWWKTEYPEEYKKLFNNENVKDIFNYYNIKWYYQYSIQVIKK